MLLVLINFTTAHRSNRSRKSTLKKQCKNSMKEILDSTLESLDPNNQCDNKKTKKKLRKQLRKQCKYLSQKCQLGVSECLQQQMERTEQYIRHYCTIDDDTDDIAGKCDRINDRLLKEVVNQLSTANKNEFCQTEEERKILRDLLRKRCESISCESDDQQDCLQEFNQDSIKVAARHCVKMTYQGRSRTCMQEFGTLVKEIGDCGPPENVQFLHRHLHEYCLQLQCDNEQFYEFYNCFLPQLHSRHLVISIYCTKSALSMPPELAMEQAEIETSDFDTRCEDCED